MRYIASDNYAGVHPTVFSYLQEANKGSEPAYGADAWTTRATEMFCSVFGVTAKAYFVSSGTAANVLALKSLVQSYESIVCPSTAHINIDECGAVEKGTGSRLEALPHKQGKITVDALEKILPLREAVHHAYPRAVSISQLTELGTCYSLEELCCIGKWCKEHAFYLHMDGARLANAAVCLEKSFKEITTDIGVDVVSFGGAKNGLMFGEAVVFLNPDLGHDFSYIQKQNMQMLSKMRFISAQFVAYLTDDLWYKNAKNANDIAAFLAYELASIPEVHLVLPVDGNELFVRMPQKIVEKLYENFYFYIIDGADAPEYPKNTPLVRLVTSFASTQEEARDFIMALKENIAGSK